MHPIDYALMQQAAALYELPETDFVKLSLYVFSRDVVALLGETNTRRTGIQAAQNPHFLNR